MTTAGFPHLCAGVHCAVCRYAEFQRAAAEAASPVEIVSLDDPAPVLDQLRAPRRRRRDAGVARGPYGPHRRRRRAPASVAPVPVPVAPAPAPLPAPVAVAYGETPVAGFSKVVAVRPKWLAEGEPEILDRPHEPRLVNESDARVLRAAFDEAWWQLLLRPNENEVGAHQAVQSFWKYRPDLYSEPEEELAALWDHNVYRTPTFQRVPGTKIQLRTRHAPYRRVVVERRVDARPVLPRYPHGRLIDRLACGHVRVFARDLYEPRRATDLAALTRCCRVCERARRPESAS